MRRRVNVEWIVSLGGCPWSPDRRDLVLDHCRISGSDSGASIDKGMKKTCGASTYLRPLVGYGSRY